MTKDRKDHAPRTLAGMARILYDANARPEDIQAAADWGIVPLGSARVWLVGYLAGRRAGRPPQAPGKVKLHDQA